MDFIICLILLFQIVNLVLLIAVANLLVNFVQKLFLKKNVPKPASGFVNLPQVPNYAQVEAPAPYSNLILLKDE